MVRWKGKSMDTSMTHLDAMIANGYRGKTLSMAGGFTGDPVTAATREHEQSEERVNTWLSRSQDSQGDWRVVVRERILRSNRSNPSHVY